MTQPLFHPARIGICILNWNTPAATLRCVRSVMEHTRQPVDICVLDNGSTDGSLKLLADGISVLAVKPLEAAGQIEADGLSARTVAGPDGHRFVLMNSERNLGFAGGVNRIVAYYETHRPKDYYVLLNSDSVLGNNLIAALLDVIQADERIGIAGATNWGLEDGGFLEGGIRYDARLESARVEYAASDVVEVDKVIGASMMVRAACFRAVGGLNAHYFLYFEDDEFCLSAKRKGYKVVYVPEASLLHSRRGTSNEHVRRYFLQRNRFLFAARNSQPSHMAANLARCFIAAQRTLLSLLLKHRDYRAAQVQYWAIQDACTGRWGQRRFADLVRFGQRSA